MNEKRHSHKESAGDGALQVLAGAIEGMDGAS